MKKRTIIITILLSFFIISSLIGILFIKDVKAISDLDYEFNKEILYNTNDISDKYNYNIRNQSQYTGHYNATYSFENEVGKEGENIKFIDMYATADNPYVKVISKYNAHSEVLDLYGNYSDNNIVISNFTNANRINGNIEFWINLDNNESVFFALKDQMLIQKGSFYFGPDDYKVYVKNDYEYENVFTWNINTWYHFNIEFNCTSDTYSIYINGNLVALDFYFESVANYIETFYIQMTPWNPIHCYIDAIGYSWDDDYTIGQNLIPYLEININIKEVDKFEFDFETFHSLYSVGTDNPSTWLDIENGYDHTNINIIDSNRCIKIEGLKTTEETTGIEKDFNSDDSIYNITWSVEFTEWNNVAGSLQLYFYSNDSTLITNLQMNEGSLYYSGNLITSGFIIDLEYEFNYYINYYDNISILTYYTEGIYQDSFIIPLLEFNKVGLNDVKIQIQGVSEGGTGNIIANLRYIGIYNSIHSFSNELGYIKNIEMYNPLDLIWYFQKHNLFNINIVGNYSICINEQTETLFTKYVDIIPLDYRSENQFVNLYDIVYDSIYQHLLEPVIYIEIYNQVEIKEINLEGVSLIINSVKNWLEFNHNEIDINISYFYVNNNRLYFTHYANENDTLEYIQAKFNIDDTYAINRSINFKTYFLGISKAYFSNNYVSETNSTFLFRLGHNSYNTILPQEQIIRSFTILITDNDNNDYYGKSEGYISNIKLIYYPDIELTILTLSLIEIMIPLIVLIIPTLAIASVYGKKAIIPMLILMTFICFISNLIVPEMFFIMMLCLGAGIFLQYKREKEKI